MKRFAAVPVRASIYQIQAADVAHFSRLRMGALQRNFDRRPLMQLPRLAQLARALMQTSQCRFILPDTTQTSAFTHCATTPAGSAIAAARARLRGYSAPPGAY